MIKLSDNVLNGTGKGVCMNFDYGNFAAVVLWVAYDSSSMH